MLGVLLTEPRHGCPFLVPKALIRDNGLETSWSSMETPAPMCPQPATGRCRVLLGPKHSSLPGSQRWPRGLLLVAGTAVLGKEHHQPDFPTRDLWRFHL